MIAFYMLRARLPFLVNYLLDETLRFKQECVQLKRFECVSPKNEIR